MNPSTPTTLGGIHIRTRTRTHTRARTHTDSPKRRFPARRRAMSGLLATITAALALSTQEPACAATPTSVDLRGYQTRMQTQGGDRGSCNFFSVIAAIEAAYKRWQGTTLDLSEEFLNHVHKMFTLVDPAGTRLPSQHAENLLGNTDGGLGSHLLKTVINNGIRVPLETAMEYVPAHTHIPAWDHWLWRDLPFNPRLDWSNPMWTTSQYNSDTINLNPTLLPLHQIAQSRVYGIQGFRSVRHNDTAALEAELAACREVVLDVALRGDTSQDRTWTGNPVTYTAAVVTRANGPSDSLVPNVQTISLVADSARTYVRGRDWAPEGSGIRWVNGGRRPATGATYWVTYTTTAEQGGHSMLLVGYNRTDPRNPYFIAKNSWGGTSIPGAGGFQYLTYDFVRRCGLGAASFTGLTGPTVWPELQVLGRWTVDDDGRRGVLDIYHLPGMAHQALADTGSGMTDRRLGTFFDAGGRAFRVNGTIDGNEVAFYVDDSDPTPPVHQLRGRRYQFRLSRNGNPTVMAGYRYDTDGSAHPGSARKDGTYPTALVSTWPLAPETYLGTWSLHLDGIEGFIQLRNRDDRGLARGWAGLTGTVFYSAGGGRQSHPVLLKVSTANPASIQVSLPRPDGRTYGLTGHMESGNPGVIAGVGTDPFWNPAGFVANRIGD